MFTHGTRPDWVVKIGDVHQFSRKCNLIERDRWAKRESMMLAGWLAPVIACADDGSWLVMVRCDEYPSRRTPAQPPHVRALKDTTITNWGLLKGRPVLLDYGYPGD